MVSENIRGEIRQRLLDSERLVRYYASVSDKYGRYNSIIRGLLYFFAVSGIASPYWSEKLFTGLTFVVGFALAIVITVDFIFEPGKKSVLLHGISIQCDRLNDQWQKLWIDAKKEEITDVVIIEKVEQLAQLETSVTSGLGYAGITQDQELNEKCHNEAEEYIRSRYATTDKTF